MPTNLDSKPLFRFIAVFAVALVAHAQTFSSGSNGGDGALNLTGTAPGTTVNFVPSNFQGNQHSLNIFNFTTITIPTGVTVKISGKTIPGPVYWLASGDVDIEGVVDVSGQAGLPLSQILDGRRRPDPGPGGYTGGVGGKTDGSTTSVSEPLGQPGDGPGGGAAGPACNGNFFPGHGGSFTGSAFLVPLVGGSGGGGGIFVGDLGSTPYAASGGSGGGALLIASSTTITVNGTINANGGAGGNGGNQGSFLCTSSSEGLPGSGGGGSGGAIRLAANTITGSGTLTALGGPAPIPIYTYPGGNGGVRIEAFADSFTGTISATQSEGSPFATFVPTAPLPSVTVTSISTNQITQPPTGSLATPDVTIDSSSSVTLTIQAAYIPVGTIITLHVFSDNNTDQTVKTTALAGSLQSSTATANVTFPSGYSLNYVKATWTSTN